MFKWLKKLLKKKESPEDVLFRLMNTSIREAPGHLPEETDEKDSKKP